MYCLTGGLFFLQQRFVDFVFNFVEQQLVFEEVVLKNVERVLYCRRN
jgi:hypothetical protein